jgi:peptidoglycan/xylan/chitin deacetylase (PgdA/CDA1 family)
VEVYEPDLSLKGKLRRRLTRFTARRPAPAAPKRPMVSFCFDDAPVTAARAGAAVLESRGLRGVYYFAAGLADTDGPMGRFAGAEDALRLSKAGHEIGCHTFSHLDCGQAGGAQVSAEIDRNTAALKAWGLPPARSFAYPYGDVSGPAKRALSDRFSSLRALHHGVMTKGGDLNQMPAVGIEGVDGEAAALHWLAQAQAQTAWLILYTHDVADDASKWGCTPGALERLTAKAMTDGFDVVTVAEGAARLGA